MRTREHTALWHLRMTWIDSDEELTLYSHMIFEIRAIINTVCLADIRYAMYSRIGVKQWIQKRP